MTKFGFLYPAGLLLWTLSCAAQATDVEFGLSGWSSQGHTFWAHDASMLSVVGEPTSRFGNPTSVLDYNGVDSKVIEVSLTMPYAGDNSFRILFGAGAIHGGTLRDDDYLSAYGATYYGTSVTGPHLVSRTTSDITGSGLYYLNFEYLPGFGKFTVSSVPIQLYLGLQFWNEKYIAQGLFQVTCTDPSSGPNLDDEGNPAPPFCPAQGTTGYAGTSVITNEAVWTTWYLGLDGRWEFMQDMSLGFKIHYSPVSYVSNEDIHHLRSDLRQDPSFSMEGFGQAIDLQLDWVYRYTEGTEFSVGYRYWDRRVTDGNWYAHGISGTSIARLNEIRTTRKGLLLGLSVNF